MEHIYQFHNIELVIYISRQSKIKIFYIDSLELFS